jgi:cell wall-associated NlpC family hydrolase
VWGTVNKPLVLGALALATPVLVVGGVTVATMAVSGMGYTGSGLNLAAGKVPAQYESALRRYGATCRAVSAPLLAAQAYQESGFDPNATSPAHARGIAQFLDSTWATHGVNTGHPGPPDVLNPQDAIAAMAKYDCELADVTRNVPGSDRTALMLAAYNAGPEAVTTAGGVPAFAETQNYVRNIESLMASYTAAPAAPISASSAGVAALYFAYAKIGTPYLWGGTGSSADEGRFDCSGLSQAAYETVGVKIPRVAADQWYSGPHPSRAELQPGDLVFFSHSRSDPSQIHHVGIYAGGGYMIDAPHTGASIRYDRVDAADFFGATRPGGSPGSPH